MKPQDIFDVVVQLRSQKLPDPKREGNVGSFFKNPTVDVQFAKNLKQNFPLCPEFKTSEEGRVKLSAAWLIDQCGWKGKQEGGAQVSNQHALVIINKGSATASDIRKLARQIQQSVHQKFRIELEIEPVFLD